MQWKRTAVFLAAANLALSFGTSVSGSAAGDKAPASYRASGLVSTASAELPDGGRVLVQGMDATQTTRTPGARPITSTLPTGVAAMGLPGPFDDPAIMARELWCITDTEGAVTIADDLAMAEADFTCDVLFVDVTCTEWKGEECIGADEVVNEDLTDTVTVSVTWVGVGDITVIRSFTRSFSPDWQMSRTSGTQRMATASGSVRGLETTYFEGDFDGASLSALRDFSIGRVPAEP